MRTGSLASSPFVPPSRLCGSGHPPKRRGRHCPSCRCAAACMLVSSTSCATACRNSLAQCAATLPTVHSLPECAGVVLECRPAVLHGLVVDCLRQPCVRPAGRTTRRMKSSGTTFAMRNNTGMPEHPQDSYQKSTSLGSLKGCRPLPPRYREWCCVLNLPVFSSNLAA
jgi:hypothetical protein